MWSFIHVADIHVGTPKSFRYQPAWNENWDGARRQIVQLKPDLLLVGGDMTRDGSTHRYELEQVKADLDALPFPVHTIPGNHEIGNKFMRDEPMSIRPDFLDRYSSVFGESEWSFVHKNVRFSGCNAFLLGSGLPDERVLRAWIADLEIDHLVDHHVFMIHPALFADTPDEPAWDPNVDRRAWYFALDPEPRAFLFDTFRRLGVSDVISAHIHCRRHLEIEGIRIHFAPSTAFAQWKHRWPDGDPSLGFLQFEIEGANLRHQFIPLTNTSRRKGYGPSGNPGLDERDYSLAWEKPPLEVP